MIQVLLILVGGLWTLAVSLAAGFALIGWLRLRLTRWEAAALGFLAGSATLAAAVFLLGLAQLWHRPGLLLAGFAAFAAWRTAPRPDFAETPHDASPRWTRWVFWAIYAAYACLYLAYALAPETSPDGSGYHLGYVLRYWDRHGVFFIDNMYAAFPPAIESLYLHAVVFGAHSSASLVHLSFLLVIPIALVALCMRHGAGPAGRLAGLAILTCPLMGRDATIAYVDVAVASLCAGAVLALDIGCRRSAFLAGLLAAFATVGKYSAAPILACAAAVLLWEGRRHWPEALRRLSLAVLGALIVASPWIARNLVHYGNPVAPFLNRWFENPWFYPSAEAAYLRVLAAGQGLPWRDLPAQVLFRGGYEGLAGPFFFLAPLALLALRHRLGRRALLLAALLLLSFTRNRTARFLIPALPFVSVAIALAAARAPKTAAFGALALAIACSPPAVERYSDPLAWRLKRLPWKESLRRIPEQDVLRRELPAYDIGRFMDMYVPPGQLVYAPEIDMLAYHRARLVGTHQSAVGVKTAGLLHHVLDERASTTVVLQGSFPARSLAAIRLVFASTGDRDPALGELRLFSRGAAIPRASDWRVRASANRWEAGLAVDGSPLSAWSPRLASASSSHLELVFPHPIDLDAVEIEGLAQVRPVAVLSRSPSGWDALPVTWAPPASRPLAALERSVAAELAALGVRWIATPGRSALGVELRQRAPCWGVSPVASAGAFTLWRLPTPD
jgi:hypothetical protein